jgi:glycerol-3-phosphate dehydrogenase
LLKETRNYLDTSKVEISQYDAKSIWSGIVKFIYFTNFKRPLVKDMSKKNTSSLSRNHEIELNEESGLISVGLILLI